jgi:L-rhamnose isomerase
MAKEIVKNDALDRVIMALDYFDASINRVSAWVTGMRNWQKALLSAMLTPWKEMKKLQDNGDFSRLMVIGEELKTAPMGDVWNEFCLRNNQDGGMKWFDEIVAYEKDVLLKRG